MMFTGSYHWSYVDPSVWDRMSVVTASTSKGEKSKKFQSLDINNIYQVRLTAFKKTDRLLL